MIEKVAITLLPAFAVGGIISVTVDKVLCPDATEESRRWTKIGLVLAVVAVWLVVKAEGLA